MIFFSFNLFGIGNTFQFKYSCLSSFLKNYLLFKIYCITSILSVFFFRNHYFKKVEPIGAPQYIRQLLKAIKQEIDSKTIIVGDFNTSFTTIDRSSKQKTNKKTQDLNDTIDQIDSIDIYRTFHPKTADYTFFSSVHGTFSRIDHILGHKSSLGKFKKIEIISRIFSDHNAMRLEINYREKQKKNTQKNLEAKQYVTK